MMRAGGPVPISADTWTFASTTTLILRSKDQNVGSAAISVVLALHAQPWSRQLRVPSPLLPTDRRYGLHFAASLHSRLDVAVPRLLPVRCRSPWRLDSTMRRRQLRDLLLRGDWRYAHRPATPLPEAHRVLRCTRLACFRSPRFHRRRGCRPRRYEFRNSPAPPVPVRQAPEESLFLYLELSGPRCASGSVSRAVSFDNRGHSLASESGCFCKLT